MIILVKKFNKMKTTKKRKYKFPTFLLGLFTFFESCLQIRFVHFMTQGK